MYNEVKKIAEGMVRDKGLINLSRLELCEKSGIADGSFAHVMGCTFTEFAQKLKDEGIVGPPGKVSKTRAAPALRRENLLGVAIALAKAGGYHKVTRGAVAEGAGVSKGLVSLYFGTMPKLHRDIMRAAVQREIVEIVAQGLANGDSHAKKASPELKGKAAKLIAEA